MGEICTDVGAEDWTTGLLVSLLDGVFIGTIVGKGVEPVRTGMMDVGVIVCVGKVSCTALAKRGNRPQLNRDWAPYILVSWSHLGRNWDCGIEMFL